MTRYAIGDIQGCKTSLDHLLQLIAFNPSRDELWLVGDLVNRGPRSLDVLRWARKLDDAVTCVLGNHDLHLLARAAGVSGPRKRDTLDEVLAARDRSSLIDWLRSRSLVHLHDGYLLVHAGLHPMWTAGDARALGAEIEHELAGPDWHAFLAATAVPRSHTLHWTSGLIGSARWRAALSYIVRARMLQRDGRTVADFAGPPSDAPRDTLPWFAVPSPAWATHTVVFGHWAALGLHVGEYHIGIDTGCVWGGQLTAIRLTDQAIFQAEAADR